MLPLRLVRSGVYGEPLWVAADERKSRMKKIGGQRHPRLAGLLLAAAAVRRLPVGVLRLLVVVAEGHAPPRAAAGVRAVERRAVVAAVRLRRKGGKTNEVNRTRRAQNE